MVTFSQPLQVVRKRKSERLSVGRIVSSERSLVVVVSRGGGVVLLTERRLAGVAVAAGKESMTNKQPIPLNSARAKKAYESLLSRSLELLLSLELLC